MQPYRVVTSADDLPAIANEIASASVLGIDTETTSKGPYERSRHDTEGKVRLFSINTGQGVHVIDAFQTKTLDPVLTAIRENKKVVSVLQNAKFDQKFLLHEYDFEFGVIFDTFRASALIGNGLELSHDLYSLYDRELRVAPEAQDLGGSDWEGNLTPGQLDYAAEDVIYLPKIRDVLKPKLAQHGLLKIAGIEFNAILPEAHAELTGLRFDAEKWNALAEKNRIEKEERRRDLIWKLPFTGKQLALPGMEPAFNLDSPAQILASLQKLGVHVEMPVRDIGGKTVWKRDLIRDTNKISLAMAAGNYKVVEELMKYRTVSKRLASFGPKYLLKWVNPRTGRVHTDYYGMLDTGRYSSSHPNLQQIPRDTLFRACICPAPGKKFIICDYSAIEMRIMAELSGDRRLIEIFHYPPSDKLRGCPHYTTASLISGLAIDKISKPQRQEAKPMNFGLIYGMQPDKLVLYAQAGYGVTMSLARAREVWAKFFQIYSGVAAWHKRALREGQKTRIVRSIGGRLRHVGEDAYNEIYNTPDQATGADGLKAALRLVYDRIKKYNGRVVMPHHVHDEIILEVDDDPELIEAAKADLEEGMIEGMAQFLQRIPVCVDSHIGDSWAEKG